MDNFNVMEYIFTKDKKWVEKINDYKDNKPIFLIVNRAYMTTRGKLQGNPSPVFLPAPDIPFDSGQHTGRAQNACLRGR